MDEEELKKKMQELDFLLQEAEDANADNQRAYDKLMKSVTEIAMIIYPQLKRMESEQIRQFGDRIGGHVSDIVEELDRIATWVEYPDRFDAEGNFRPGSGS